jgi:hypothetical protein
MIRKEKIKEIDYLLNKFKEKNIDFGGLPKCSFLIGAGCSKSSGIPTGYEVIEVLRKLWYLNNYTNCNDFKKGDFEIIEEKFKELDDDFQIKYLEQETLLKERVEIEFQRLKEKTPNYLKSAINSKEEESLKDKIFNDLLYGFWFEIYSENPKERQKLIESFIDLKEPSGAYLLFSHLIANGKITNVFTTNFDDLIYDSLIRYTDIKPKVYSHNEVAQYINTHSPRPNIIKLHGDFLFENIKNIIRETDLLWTNMESKLGEALKSFDLIVVGYNGADDSVMNTLDKLKINHFGLLWCGSDPESVNWRVKELINNTSNSYFIKIKSFELLVFELYNAHKKEIQFPDFISNAEKKEKEIHDFIYDFKVDLNEDATINNQDKENINNTLEIVLDKNSFFKISEQTLEEQLKFIERLRIDGIGRTLKNIFSHISWEQAKELYEKLDNGSFFQDKLKEASIQHISNALTNLNKIDSSRTIKILESVEDGVLFKKIEEATPEDLYSGISELKSISQNKIEHIISERKLSPEIFEIRNQDLRRITYKLKTLSKTNGVEFLIANSDKILLKLKSEPLKEVVLFFDSISDVYFKECRTLFDSLENDKLTKKIEEQNPLLLSITLKSFNQLNKEKTKLLVESIDKNKLVNSLNKNDLLSIKSILFALKDIDFKLARNLLNLLTDDVLIAKIKESELLNIAESLEYLSKIDSRKISVLFHKIDKSVITNKIDSESFSYQQFGNAMSKLIIFDFDSICSAARNANSERLSNLISATLNKTGEQVFLHFVPTYFKVDRNLFSEIVKKASQEYIDSILKWSKIDLYTVNLPYLKRTFDNNNMEKESKYVEYIISNNQERFNKKKKRNENKH